MCVGEYSSREHYRSHRSAIRIELEQIRVTECQNIRLEGIQRLDKHFKNSVVKHQIRI